MGIFSSKGKTSLPKPVVLITGCSAGGIGDALCKEFNKAGCQVYATARKSESMQELADMGLKTLVLDVTVESTIKSAVDKVIAEAGRIDILVNNAGAGCVGPIAEIALQRVREHFETNVFGAVAVTNAVFPHMAKQGSGKIVNVGSVVGWIPLPFGGAYSAGKAALHLITDALRMESKPFGVQVMSVHPGAIKSNIGDNAAAKIVSDSYTIYKPFESVLEARARASQNARPTPTAVFAKKLVQATLCKHMPAHFTYGSLSTIFKLLSILPTALSDFLLMRKFNLNEKIKTEELQLEASK